MNKRRKAGVDRSLRLVQAVIIACTYALPLRAEQPPTPAPAPSLEKSDPLAILNEAFRESYKTLRDHIVLPKTGPIIFQIGDNMTLMKGASLVASADGKTTVRSDTSTTAPALTSRYHELKAIAHVSLALYTMLIPAADSKLDEAGLAKLREYRVKVYLTYPGVRAQIDQMVSEALGNEPCVVLSHSLGTVVTYNVLWKRAALPQCPRLITVGSPLGIKAIKLHIERPLRSPPCAGHWFNAYDDRDVVALVALDARNFDVSPPIENKSDVKNFTENRHGIDGYLADPVVAQKIVELLV